MKYSFHPAAFEEYLGAVKYYSRISQHLGESFVDEVESGVERILSQPKGWPCLEGDVRRCLLRRFPYGIYYCIENEAILVYAVMHLSRRPDYWRERLS